MLENATLVVSIRPPGYALREGRLEVAHLLRATFLLLIVCSYLGPFKNLQSFSKLAILEKKIRQNATFLALYGDDPQSLCHPSKV